MKTQVWVSPMKAEEHRLSTALLVHQVIKAKKRAPVMWRLHLSNDKNSLHPPPLNFLSGCHGSSEGGERGASRDCK